MRTLILLFATLSTVHVFAQQTATQSVGNLAKYVLSITHTKGLKQAVVQVESRMTFIQKEMPINEIAHTGDKCSNTIAATTTDITKIAESTFTFMGDTYPDLPVLESAATAPISAPTAIILTTTFYFMGDSFQVIPVDDMLITDSTRQENTFKFMGDTYIELPEERLIL